MWEKDLLGRVPQVSLDLFAKQYALEVVLLLTRIDERLNEEKQKLSAPGSLIGQRHCPWASSSNVQPRPLWIGISSGSVAG